MLTDLQAIRQQLSRRMDLSLWEALENQLGRLDGETEAPIVFALARCAGVEATFTHLDEWLTHHSRAELVELLGCAIVDVGERAEVA